MSTWPPWQDGREFDLCLCWFVFMLICVFVDLCLCWFVFMLICVYVDLCLWCLSNKGQMKIIFSVMPLAPSFTGAKFAKFKYQPCHIKKIFCHIRMQCWRHCNNQSLCPRKLKNENACTFTSNVWILLENNKNDQALIAVCVCVCVCACVCVSVCVYRCVYLWKCV